MGEINELCHCDGLGWQAKFHDDRFRHSSDINAIISTILEGVTLVILVGEMYTVLLLDGPV
jgi:hypothetical protein